MQTIVMTSDVGLRHLPGFCRLWNKYNPSSDQQNVVCGFTPPSFRLPGNFRFHSIGRFEDFPAGRWSNALCQVLEEVAQEVFILMFDDFWPVRPMDCRAIEMIYDYMFQFQNVIKFDLTTERLYADGGGKYLFGYNTYETLGYLDLIKSDHGSQYHLSLWGGMWRRDLLRRFIVPDETAQQIELNGTGRLAQVGDSVLVLGTRQAPMRHANVFQNGKWNQDATVGLPAIKSDDIAELKELGYI